MNSCDQRSRRSGRQGHRGLGYLLDHIDDLLANNLGRMVRRRRDRLVDDGLPPVDYPGRRPRSRYNRPGNSKSVRHKIFPTS